MCYYKVGFRLKRSEPVLGRYVISFITLFSVITLSVYAQPTALEAGDPPLASLITVSRPDANGIVTIEGASGSVFPAAEVAVRNLYTSDIIYVQATITGQFTARLPGTANAPFWISPARTFPVEVRNETGSVPGGPGTILYAPFPETEPARANPSTRLVVDGIRSDWDAYPNAAVDEDIHALRNLNAIYLVTSDVPEEYAHMRVQFRVNTTAYGILLDPRNNGAATWEEFTTVPRDLGTLGIDAASQDDVELRLPLAAFEERANNNVVDTLELAEISYLDDNGSIIQTKDYNLPVNTVIEEDGVVYAERAVDDRGEAIHFMLAGTVAQGASTWEAQVYTNELVFNPGDMLNLEMDVRLSAPTVPESLSGLEIIGRIGLQPISLVENGLTSITPLGGNGWSTELTPSGLPIDNISTEVVLSEVRVPAPQVIHQGDTLTFGLPFSVSIPEDLPAGVYVPYFEGFGRVGDGPRFRWDQNSVLGQGERPYRPVPTRMPTVLQVGRSPEAPVDMIWTLFHAHPNQGGLGVIAEEQRDQLALSNRVRFSTPTAIISPGERNYPLEPYLINMLPNAYGYNSAPLLPLLLPNGRMSATLQRPNGTTETLTNQVIVQNVLSTALLDERDLFGQQAPLDVYRLTTLDEVFTSPILDDYGDYEVQLEGSVEDVWGNRYRGGGTYRFTVAEPLGLQPAVLVGTPFEVGDNVNLGVHVVPGGVADVTVTMRVYPLDGGEVVETVYNGETNDFGSFIPDTSAEMSTPGEYVIDYEARLTDDAGRLWAGSLRSAGVIASPNPTLMAHGQRGLAGVDLAYNPAWFFAEQYAPIDSTEARFYPPYHSGDVAWITDGAQSGLQPVQTLQDTNGDYSQWFRESHPDYVRNDGVSIDRLAVRDTLPIDTLGEDAQGSAQIGLTSADVVNDSYSYISYVTPVSSARQLVLGGPTQFDDYFWDLNDPLLGQIGAGPDGVRPGDYAFLFGGAVVRNPVADVQESVIYASLAVVIAENDPRTARVFPPYRGAGGGPNGGPLWTRDEQPIDMFFYPTSIRPGDVLQTGDIFTVTGQVAPTLASNVEVRLTSPSDVTTVYRGQANAIGYFYDPTADFVVEEPGVWTVQITVSHDGASSAAEQIPSVQPTGTQKFNVYVVPSSGSKLDWDFESLLSIPAGFPYNFTFTVPPGWTDARAYVTETIPSTVLQDSEVTIQGTALRYQFNPAGINQRFPYYEGQDGRIDGAASSDPVTLTFVITGTNATGQFDIRARQVTIRHDHLLTVE
jgi:hypothetical protein